MSQYGFQIDQANLQDSCYVGSPQRVSQKLLANIFMLIKDIISPRWTC